MKAIESNKEFMKNNKMTWMRRLFDPRNYKFSPDWITKWNSHVDVIMGNVQVIIDRCLDIIEITIFQVIESFQLIHDYNETLDVVKRIIYQLVNGLDSSMFSANQIHKLCTHYADDGYVKRITDLSVLEMCLLIAIKHHSEIYDHDPFNFEIIFTRLNKFVKASHMNPYDRSIVLASFEKLQVTLRHDFYSKFN